jgi:hypothetical protein
MDDNGTMGGRVSTEDWSTGWTSVEILDNFLFLLKSNGPAHII